jgi:hypothetical protein
MRFRAVLLTAWCSVLACAVQAAPISVTTGPPNETFDATSDWYIMADDFSFPVDTVLTHIASGHLSGTWLLFDGSSGSLPGPLLAYGAIEPLDADGRFPVAHVLLTGGDRYWYGSYNGELDVCPYIGGGGSYFSGTDANGSAIALVATHSRRDCRGDVLEGWLDAFAGGGSYWSREHLPDSFTDLSFSAYGETVPEPASVLLTTVGLGAVLRRRLAGRYP